MVLTTYPRERRKIFMKEMRRTKEKAEGILLNSLNVVRLLLASSCCGLRDADCRTKDEFE